MENTKKFYLKPFLYWTIIVAFIASIITFFYNNIEKFDNQQSNFSTISGRKISQTLVGSDCERVSEKVRNEISNIEKKISHDFCNSYIDLLNNSNGAWVDLDDFTIDILEKIIRISRKTNGLYDPTYLTLIKMYDQNSEKDISDSTILEELQKVNFNFIEIDKQNNRARINGYGTLLTLNDIIDGIACNIAINFYKNSKINKAMIQVGNCTGYFNYSDKKEDQNVQNGFICTLDKSQRIINPNSGRIITKYLPKSFYHQSDGIIACILARICASVDEKESSKVVKLFENYKD